MDRGCTQGDTDSPIIFNIIVDGVLRSWKGNEAYEESDALFYADDGLMENTDPEKLQKDMNRIIALFEKVGLRTNETKTKYMVFRGPTPPKEICKVAYDRMNSGVGKTYEERRREAVKCEICGKNMKRGSLQRHMLNQHNIKPEQYLYNKESPNQTFKINFWKGKDNKCPIPGCTGGGKDKWGMYRHFCLKHFESNLIIKEDGELPRCNLCGMYTKDVTAHQKTKTCLKGKKRRECEILQNKQAEADDVVFKVYGENLERVQEFKYLGRTLREDDDDTKTIVNQIKKARQKWNAIARILKREGANAKTMAKFYMAIVQAVLLYGSDSWTISKGNWRRLESFHKQALRHMSGKHIQKNQDGTWSYPNHAALEKKCGLFDIKTYIKRRRGTLRKYLEEYRPELLERAMNTQPPARNANKVLWWKQPYITKDEMAELKNFWFK